MNTKRRISGGKDGAVTRQTLSKHRDGNCVSAAYLWEGLDDMMVFDDMMVDLIKRNSGPNMNALMILKTRRSISDVAFGFNVSESPLYACGKAITCSNTA